MLNLVIGVCVLFLIGVSIKFGFLFLNIRDKKRRQRIITPKERIEYRNWAMAFATAISAVLIGLGSALVAYL